jgi:hypothetical protein
MDNAKDTYEIRLVNSSSIKVPRSSYQRELNPRRVQKIVREFDEHIANEPKISYRDKNFYVFDGQHTIAARKYLNGNQDLDIRCKVYYDLTEKEEALLFAQQTGTSAMLTPGAKLRAEVFGEKTEALAFLAATEGVGLKLDYSQRKGEKRIACIGTAFEEFSKFGADVYQEALSILLAAWHGDPESLRRENVQAMVRFVDLYRGEYNPERLVARLRHTDPLTIYREGRLVGSTLSGYKKYLYQVFRIYNGHGIKTSLPMKF